MGSQRTTFDKLQRDRAKKAKAAAKRERRLEKQVEPGDDAPPERPPLDDGGGELSAAQLLEQIERIHQQFEAKQIDLEEFEERKADLLGRLPID